MYLVDTSVWIDYLRGRENGAAYYFKRLLNDMTPYGISAVIYQEVLQGAGSQQDFNYLASYLGTMKFYHPKDSVQSYYAAAKLYYDCRKAGVTLCSTIDCLIATIAIENKLILLHNDKDFDRIGEVTPSLSLLSQRELEYN